LALFRRRPPEHVEASSLPASENLHKHGHSAASITFSSSAYVPPLQRTEGQPPPIAANDGLSYMSFAREGDAGTAAALEDALTCRPQSAGSSH
jgi:hypothetical protein